MTELSPQLSYIVLAVAGLLLAAAGVLVLAVFQQLKQLRARCTVLETRVQDLAAKLASEIAGVGASAARQLTLARDVDQLRHRQDQLELRMADSQTYGQAEQLVKRGAGMDELIAHCGLSRGEAELVLRMHRFRETG